jgi:hypothetical protein
MKRIPSVPLREWLYIIAAWIIIMYLYGFVAFWGTSAYLRDGIVTDYMRSWPAHLEMILGGVFFGLLFAAVNTFTDRSGLSPGPTFSTVPWRLSQRARWRG